MRYALVLTTALALAIPSFAQHPSRPMTNRDVVQLVALGLSDALVIDKIHNSRTNFDTSVEGLKTLKAAKVPDTVIQAMINPNATNTSSPVQVVGVAAPTPQLEIGVYVMRSGRQMALQPEIVNWQTGGVLKETASAFIVKGDVNGKVMKGRCAVRLENPVELVVRTPEGTSVTEYQLLRLHRKGNRREFRAVTGGVLHRSGGAVRDNLPFEPEQVDSRTWKIHLMLPDGEYGLLPPGVSSLSISSSGKIYAFGVDTETSDASRNWWNIQK